MWAIIRCRASNTRPLNHETPSVTTRPKFTSFFWLNYALLNPSLFNIFEKRFKNFFAILDYFLSCFGRREWELEEEEESHFETCLILIRQFLFTWSLFLLHNVTPLSFNFHTHPRFLSVSGSLSLSFTHTVSKSYSVSLSGMLILFLLCHSFPILSYHLHMFFTYNSASIFKRFFAFSSKTAAVAFEPQVLKRCWPLCCYDQKLVFHFGNPRPLFVYFCIFKQERCGHRKQIGVNDGIWAHNLSIMSPLS